MSRHVFQDFRAFLSNPTKSEPYTKMPARSIFALLMVTLTLVVPFSFLLDWLGVDQFDSILEKMLAENKWVVLFLVIVVAPLMEESIFRLHLDLRITSIWWGLGLSMILISQQWYFTVAFMAYLIYLLVRVFRQQPPDLKFVVFVSSLFFAIVHLGNYSNFELTRHFHWIPVLVAAQFLIGLILSYIRLTHGVRYAMLFHGVYNAILIIPVVYFYEG